jgi:hypothetical protein
MQNIGLCVVLSRWQRQLEHILQGIKLKKKAMNSTPSQKLHAEH